MSINAVKFGALAVASAAAGGLVGLHTGKKIRKASQYDYDQVILNHPRKQEKKKHPLRKLLGTALLVASAVVLAKTPQGKKLISKAKEVLSPVIDKVKATNIGKKAIEYAGKAKQYVADTFGKVKLSPFGAKAEKFVQVKVKPVLDKAKTFVVDLFKTPKTV